MKKLLSILLALVMVFALTVPALAAAPEADLDPPLWHILGYDSYEELMDYYWTEEEYAEELSSIRSFMETRPDETARLRANAYSYYETAFAEEYGSAQEYMTAWNETEEQFITDMTVWQIWDLQEAEEYADRWAALCAEQPEETARFLEELPGWFESEYGDYYGSFEEYSAYYSSAEEAYLRLFDYWSWHYTRQQGIDEFILSHGGTPGRLNVMVNGTFLSVGSERPIYEADGVTYADAQALSRALGVPVTANESGYAPVRATAEALGCMVYWDSDYNAAVVIDPAALAGEIDSKFTLFNRLWDTGVSADANYVISGESDAELTVFNSLDGDMTRQASFAYDLTVSPTAVSGSVDYDLSLLWDLFQEYIPSLLVEDQDDGYEQQVALLTALLSGRMDLRADLEEGMAYLSLPSLLPNTWLRYTLDETVDADELRQLYDRSSSVGQLFCSTLQNSYFPVLVWESALEGADAAAALIGDERFVRDGSAQVLTLTRDEVMSALGEEMDPLCPERLLLHPAPG